MVLTNAEIDAMLTDGALLILAGLILLLGAVVLWLWVLAAESDDRGW